MVGGKVRQSGRHGFGAADNCDVTVVFLPYAVIPIRVLHIDRIFQGVVDVHKTGTALSLRRHFSHPGLIDLFGHNAVRLH